MLFNGNGLWGQNSMRALGLLLAILCVCSTAQAETRLALVIGNSRYENIAPLRNPENDIGVVSESLEAVGFEVIRLSNADGAAMLKSVSDLSTRAAAAASQPTVMIYFAGHGIQRDGKNYLLPVDFKTDDLGDVAGNSIELETVIAELKQANASVQMIILDACRNDPFERTDRSAVPIETGFAKVDDATGTLIAFSTAPGKTASDGETGTSPYASAFAETILLPGLPVQTTFERVGAKVKERTKGEQEPWENSALYGEFKFVPNAPQTEISEIEALLWDNVALLDSAEAYQRYIDRFPSGLYSKLAKRKIDNINRDFAFRKQAETFPIITSTDDKLEFCWQHDSKPRLPGAGWQLNTFLDYQGELVYIDFSIPLVNVMCPKGQPYVSLIAVSGSAGQCSSMIDLSLGEDAGREADLTCTDKVDFTMSLGADYAIDKAGGLIVRSSGGDELILAAGQRDFYDYNFSEIEGYVENSVVRVTGLVRVEVSMPEEAITVELIPVDPATLGLSWKYHNTLEAYRKGPEASGAKVIPLIDRGKAILKAVEEEAAKTDRQQKNAPVDEGWVSLSVRSEGEITSVWTHNGSFMGLAKYKNERALVYIEPRDGLAGIGIQQGSPLFEGTSSDGTSYTGWGFAYPERCDQRYKVTGKVSSDNKRIVLKGKAPKYDDDCQVVGNRDVSMTFDFLERVEQESASSD